MLKCPRSRTLLNEAAKAGVLLDVCERCLGMWLHRGELEKLSTRLKEIEREWNA